jgi:hypothetical protein
MSRKEFLITIIVVVVLSFVLVSRLYDAGRRRDDFSDLQTGRIAEMQMIQNTAGANAELNRK